jgi:hypothetical protein
MAPPRIGDGQRAYPPTSTTTVDRPAGASGTAAADAGGDIGRRGEQTVEGDGSSVAGRRFGGAAVDGGR